MRRSRLTLALPALVVTLLLIAVVFTAGAGAAPHGTSGSGLILTDEPAPDAVTSHRLIVQLSAPSWAEYARINGIGTLGPALQDVDSAEARAYIAQLALAQAETFSALQLRLPSVELGHYLDESGQAQAATYQVVFNGMTIDPGPHSYEEVRRALSTVPGVRALHRDYRYDSTLYASLPFINAPTLWADPGIGGQANAGTGIKVASMDGGVHRDAPMFDGTGYSAPPGYPRGELANTNDKLIVSRAYFRPWDPPAPGDENSWPGVNGTSHGVHTASTAAGNAVTGSYLGVTENLSGVAPRAYVLSYRVFYASVNNDPSFYTAEGLAALEDIVLDDADVLNNSWGGGPTSVGAPFDALDQALVNVASAGIFISMSAGNAGPSGGTTDHPSDDYIVVAAVTDPGEYATGRLSVTAPDPVPPALEEIPYSNALFGPPPVPGSIITLNFLPAEVVSPTNNTGCSPFPAGAFAGQAAVVFRGDCAFSLKVINAQNAGAQLVVIYNNAGDDVVNMSCNVDCDLVTVPAVFVGQSDGEALVAWYGTHGPPSELELNNMAFQIGATADIIADFSSRGPGVGNRLKPDIAAPGVSILAQGYDPAATGEARHLGFGQASGTSMAAPHVAGAAALLRQLHPGWSNEAIKSALMSTSKYLDVFTESGAPAQPLDMGAGRLDLTRAADPGVILRPASISYGNILTGTAVNSTAITVTLTSVAAASETYDVSTLYTGDGFTATSALPGVTVSPAQVTLAPGEEAQLIVTFDAMAPGVELGDNQGYIVLSGSAGHEAHLPLWARITYEAAAPILLLDNDGSSTLALPDYASYYMQTLDNLGLAYTYRDLDVEAAAANFPGTHLETVDLLAYDAVIYFSGDNFQPNGTFVVPTPLSTSDLYRLNEYAQNGGALLVMGQDFASLVSADDGSVPLFYDFTLGGEYLQDSVTGGTITPTFFITDTPTLPLDGITLDLSTGGDGADNQVSVDEIASTRFITVAGEADIDYTPVLQHRDPSNVEVGITGMAHRDQPTLESPGLSYLGRSLYYTFGLEGINNDTGFATRETLVDQSLRWLLDDPAVTIGTAVMTQTVSLTANFVPDDPTVSALSYRWDFGDGSPFAGPAPANQVVHTYATCEAPYVVRVEVLDSIGNRTIGEQVVSCGTTAVTLGQLGGRAAGGWLPALAALALLGGSALGVRRRRR